MNRMRSNNISPKSARAVLIWQNAWKMGGGILLWRKTVYSGSSSYNKGNGTSKYACQEVPSWRSRIGGRVSEKCEGICTVWGFGNGFSGTARQLWGDEHQPSPIIFFFQQMCENIITCESSVRNKYRLTIVGKTVYKLTEGGEFIFLPARSDH